eukprot:6356769-Pyramimonas_sp.AAC.1
MGIDRFDHPYSCGDNLDDRTERMRRNTSTVTYAPGAASSSGMAGPADQAAGIPTSPWGPSQSNAAAPPSSAASHNGVQAEPDFDHDGDDYYSWFR